MSHKLISHAKKLRDTNHYTCVVLCEPSYQFTSYDKGVMPLYHLNKHNILFNSPPVLADKIIGKASAFLAIRLGIKTLDTLILSTEAQALLQHYQVSYSFNHQVPFIANRLQTGQCPMEQLLDGITDVEKAWTILDTFIQNREKRGKS